MALYIGTESECEDYNEKVSSSENYSGRTERWAIVRKHPQKNIFAIKRHRRYSCDMELVEELSPDWNSRN